MIEEDVEEMLIKAFGPYACFTRPEYKVERVSYDVITPSAAKGLIESVYWHPGVVYVIDKIYVRSPIRFQSITRRELKTKCSISTNSDFYKNGYVTPIYSMRSSNVLQNVCYYISFHIEVNEEARKENGDSTSRTDFLNKSYGILSRRLNKGSYYYPPHFGCSEYPANLELVETIEECPNELLGTRYLGRMLKENDYNKDTNNAKYFTAVMKDGCIEVD